MMVIQNRDDIMGNQPLNALKDSHDDSNVIVKGNEEFEFPKSTISKHE